LIQGCQILGADDRHLDFRPSLLRRREVAGATLYATTTVRTHNLLGRVYIKAILPFHIIVVRSMLARAA